MTSCRFELGISPLSHQEVERTLAAIRRAWHPPSWVRRQAYCGAWLLTIRHEIAIQPDDDPAKQAEKLAAAIWHAIGRFARITVELRHLSPRHDNEGLVTLRVFDESDYRLIQRCFRFNHPRMRQ